MTIVTPMPLPALAAGTAAGTPEQRIALGMGFVDLGNLILTHGQLPIVRFGGDVSGSFTYSLWPLADLDAQRAEVDRVAAILGVKAELTPDGTLYRAERHLGPVSYRATSMPVRQDGRAAA